MAQNPLEVVRYIVSPLHAGDPRSAGYLADAHALGLHQIQGIDCLDLYFIEGQLTEAELQQIGSALLSDPVTQKFEVKKWSSEGPQSADRGLIEVALRPGVTDPVAEQIVRAAHQMGVQGVKRVSTGLQFRVRGEGLGEKDLDTLARRLLANPIIQRYALREIEPVFPQAAEASGEVEFLPIRTMDEAQLLACSTARRAALDLAEMRAIQVYFQKEGRDCTDIEFEMIAQTWSEHCVHKTFKALIEMPPQAPAVYPPTINNILNTYIRKATDEIQAPWVISAFSDNAGILDFDADYEVSFKVETHNHPSAVEPFGGANTGVGGVIRDVLGVSARPIAATDILCFGPQNLPLDTLPEGVLHPRRIFSGVVAGVQDYGNKLGLPTVNGAIWYDEGYTSNPLVYCGCVGLAPKNKHCRTPQKGDRVIVLGGRTGRDGLRGATFSSQTMDAQTGEVAGASVQIGAPITEKIVMEVVLRARDEGLYHAITDCGAGGLSSAVGEMASEIGGDVDLAQVPLKYPGLAPWEIWLSEAQERMVLAVPPAAMERLLALCALYEVEWTDMGEFTGSGRLVVRYNGKQVLALENAFLHDGIPQRRLKAAPAADLEALWQRPQRPSAPASGEALLRLLAHPNITSKAAVIRIYDHEIQGGTWVKPLTGRENDGPSDACVLKPTVAQGSRAFALSNGFNPEYGKWDSYRMAWSVVDEAVRNAVAVGADPAQIAILDNFCWGDPLRPEVMWSLVEAARGCYDAARAFGTPFVSGKDSFNNEYIGADQKRHSIPPSLLISALGMVPDASHTATMDLKEAGNPLYLVGEWKPAWGGSHYSLCWEIPAGQPEEVPTPSLRAPAVYARLHQALAQGWLRACHDLSEGGLAVSLAEMCLAARSGATVSLPEGAETELALFGESNGCLLVEVAKDQAARFEAWMKDMPMISLGSVNADQDPVLRVNTRHGKLEWGVETLVQAWTAQNVEVAK